MAEMPNLQDLQKYVVNREGWEAVRQGLFDSAAYPTTGITQINFFQNPIGQGIGVSGGAKTPSDTNMNLAGQMPAMQGFLVEAIEILFATSTPTVAATMPAVFGAKAVAAQVNDSFIFRRSGNLNFLVGSKAYACGMVVNRYAPA